MVSPGLEGVFAVFTGTDTNCVDNIINKNFTVAVGARFNLLNEFFDDMIGNFL